MESQFRQPKRVINVEVNKQSIARNFGIGDNEVCYAKAGQLLSGYKAIYDKASQRAYFLPAGLTGTVTSMSIAGVLTHSAGTVDLAELAAERGEFFNTQYEFGMAYTLNTHNETILFGACRYRWAGALPKVMSATDSPINAGGIADGAWVICHASAINTPAGGSVADWMDVVHIQEFTNRPYSSLAAFCKRLIFENFKS